MFCKNCGKEIADSSKFCVNCGTPVDMQRTAPVYEQPVASAPADRTRAKKNKKKLPVWVYIVVVLGFAAIGRLVGENMIAPSMGGETEYGNEITASSNVQIINSEYAEIFSSRNIVEVDQVFLYDSSAYAKVDAEGMVERMEYGYEDDVVKEMVDTLYYPISGMTDSEKAALSSQLDILEMSVASEGFCSVTRNESFLFYSITFYFKNLEDPQNLQKLIDLGMMTDNGADCISKSESESALLREGFVKKWS